MALRLRLLGYTLIINTIENRKNEIYYNNSSNSHIISRRIINLQYQI